jgi:hypothetical protein
VYERRRFVPQSQELASEPFRSRTKTTPSPFGIGFVSPEEEETELHPSQTIPSPASSPEASDEHEPASEHDEPNDEQYESLDGTHSTESSRVTNPLNGTGLRDTFRNGVIIASHQAHTYLARTAGQLEAGLYMADEDDAERIADPLARIAQRREGIGQVSPDTADLMAAMMGLAGYATKQIQKQATAKKIDLRNQGIQVVPEGAGEQVAS